ncbi:MAG: formylglycine-generating enzyme family protein [Acidobacteriota bacterium]
MKPTLYFSFVLLLLGCTTPAVPDPVATAPVADQPAQPLPGEMVAIPAGEFIMGSDEKPQSGPAVAMPQHTVNLPEYQIDVYEVTNGEFLKFETESNYEAEGDWRQYYSFGKEDFPVANLTWTDAQAYCEWAGKRLPTEAEWEKAARGAEGSEYPWGETWDPTKSNVNEMGYANTVEVGQFELDKSPFGLYDTMGNVQEWTSDPLKPYPGSPLRGSDVFNYGNIAVRGGSYALKGGSMALWSRSSFPKNMQAGIGCRCVKDGAAAADQAAAEQ